MCEDLFSNDAKRWESITSYIFCQAKTLTFLNGTDLTQAFNDDALVNRL